MPLHISLPPPPYQVMSPYLGQVSGPNPVHLGMMDLPRGSPAVGFYGSGMASVHAGPGQGQDWGGMGPRWLTHSSMPLLMLGWSTASFPAVTIRAGIVIYRGQR